MNVVLFIVAIAALCLLLFWLDRREKPMPKHWEELPAPPKPFTPLADSLAGKLPPELPRDPVNTLPRERPLPKPRKRPVHKGGK